MGGCADEGTRPFGKFLFRGVRYTFLYNGKIMTDASPQKTLKSTLTTAVCCALSLMMPHAGFAIFLVAIPWLPWAVFTMVRAVRNPDRRKFHMMQIGIWVFALTVVLAVHEFYSYRARQYADEIVLKVKDWHTAHGAYPCTVKDIGVDLKEMRNRLGYSAYACREEKIYPFFFYANTFEAFTTWSYDFERDVWVYIPD